MQPSSPEAGERQGGKIEADRAVFFRQMESANKTATTVKKRYEQFVELYPEVFITEQDKTLRFSNEAIAAFVEELSGLKLIDLGVSDEVSLDLENVEAGTSF